MSQQYLYYDTAVHGYVGVLEIGTNNDGSAVLPASTTTAGWAISSNYFNDNGVNFWSTVNGDNPSLANQGFYWLQKLTDTTKFTLGHIYGDPTFTEFDYYVNDNPAGFIGASATEMFLGTPNSNPFNHYVNNGDLTFSVDPGFSVTIYGSTSGGIKLQVPAMAGANTLTFPAGTTDFSSTGGASQVVKQTSAGGAFTTGQVATSEVKTTSTNDNAAAGGIGEYIKSNIPIASKVGLSTATAKTIASVSLTAGDWDVTGTVAFAPDAGTLIVDMKGGISQTDNTLPTLSDTAALVDVPLAPSAGVGATIPVGVSRLSLAGTTIIYLVAQCTFSVSTNSAYGFISARRRR
jgi:hypothetical protein